MAPVGEPKDAAKPQHYSTAPLIFLLSLAALCGLFILWRKANSLRTVVGHQLKTWTVPDGRIRLSEDDGPPANSFLEDSDDDEFDDEPLASRAQRLRESSAEGRPKPPSDL